MNKKQLYESIMTSVAKQVKSALNESSQTSKLREINSELSKYGTSLDDIGYYRSGINNKAQHHYKFDMLTDDMIEIIENPTFMQMSKMMSVTSNNVCIFLCGEEYYVYDPWWQSLVQYYTNVDGERTAKTIDVVTGREGKNKTIKTFLEGKCQKMICLKLTDDMHVVPTYGIDDRMSSDKQSKTHQMLQARRERPEFFRDFSLENEVNEVCDMIRDYFLGDEKHTYYQLTKIEQIMFHLQPFKNKSYSVKDVDAYIDAKKYIHDKY